MNTIVELLQRRIWIGLLIGLVIGVGLGLFIGWGPLPVTWVPNTDDILTVAEAYDLTKDAVVARARLKNVPLAEQDRLLKRAVQEQLTRGNTIAVARLNSLAQALSVPVTVTTPVAGITPVVTGVVTRPLGSPTPSTQLPFDVSALIPILVIVFAFLLIAGTVLVFVLRVLPSLRARQTTRAEGSARAGTATAGFDSERLMPHVPSPPATTTPGGLGRFVPTYTLGNDNYDTSYSLETARGEFLGECGMGISETIGEGKPDKVVAFDLWLFDKADVRTVTQILMSEYAFKDQTLRTKLGTKGEAVLIEKGKTLRLETASLRVDAQIVDVVYATNANYPPNSHFQKLIVEIVPSQKEGGTAR